MVLVAGAIVIGVIVGLSLRQVMAQQSAGSGADAFQ